MATPAPSSTAPRRRPLRPRRPPPAPPAPRAAVHSPPLPFPPSPNPAPLPPLDPPAPDLPHGPWVLLPDVLGRRRRGRGAVAPGRASPGLNTKSGGSSTLNPQAPPLHGSSPPSGYGERLSFSDLEDYDDSKPPSPPPEGMGRSAPHAGRRRRRPRRRWRARDPAGIMAAARRSPPPREISPRQRRTISPVAHPARASGPPDADGFHTVQSRRRWRRRSPPKQSKPVPPHLVGRCFNCMGKGHVRANCVSKSCCINCGSDCHRRKDCPFPPLVASGKRRRSPPQRPVNRCAAPRLHAEPGRRPAGSDKVVSGRSASTGRSTSVPNCCASPQPAAADSGHFAVHPTVTEHPSPAPLPRHDAQ